MKRLILYLIAKLASALRERWHLSLEVLALRHQVEVLKRSATRPRFPATNHCWWLIWSRWWSQGPHALKIIHVDTVAKYMRRRPSPPSPTWRTFLRHQGAALMAGAFYAAFLEGRRAVYVTIIAALRHRSIAS
jgi:hypothetical protein